MNKGITIYELIGLIKDNEAPKKIKIDTKIWFFYKNNKETLYIDNEKSYLKSCSLNFNYYIDNNKLNDTVEILPEKNEMVEMKEMVYQKDRKVELLYSGTYKGYGFYIMNLGTYPTAYVNVEKNPLLNKKIYDKIDISVHGGLTYSDYHLDISLSETITGWFIGWDYIHCYDYNGYEIDMPEETRINGKKWTTEEIFEDVKSVIEQCINYKENDEWEDIKEIVFLEDEESNDKINRNFEIFANEFNKLIKNQKYLKEMVQSLQRPFTDEIRVETTKWIEDPRKEKLESKNE